MSTRISKRSALLLISLLILSAFLTMGATECTTTTAPTVENDNSGASYRSADGNPVYVPSDDYVYTIKGVVIADPRSLVRQTEAGGGSVSGFSANGVGTVSGTFWGPTISGKGYIRLFVLESDTSRSLQSKSGPGPDIAPKGKIVILKSTDTKASALLPGDIVTFKCRRQYEAVAAVNTNEVFDTKKAETWELDFARLASPTISQVSSDTLAEIKASYGR